MTNTEHNSDQVCNIVEHIFAIKNYLIKNKNWTQKDFVNELKSIVDGNKEHPDITEAYAATKNDF